MSIVGKKIKLAREEKGWSQQELADKCGWESYHSKISSWENGKRDPKSQYVQKIAEVTEKPLSWFYTDFQGVNSDDPYSEFSIPIVDFSSLISRENISYTELPRLNLYKPESIAIPVNDDSMTSINGVSFPSNCLLIVSFLHKAVHGNYVIAQLDDDSIVFRQLILEGHERYLRALNPSWKPINLNDRIKILGVVISSLVNFK